MRAHTQEAVRVRADRPSDTHTRSDKPHTHRRLYMCIHIHRDIDNHIRHTGTHHTHTHRHYTFPVKSIKHNH